MHSSTLSLCASQFSVSEQHCCICNNDYCIEMLKKIQTSSITIDDNGIYLLAYSLDDDAVLISRSQNLHLMP